MSLENLHPAVSAWFASQFPAPTQVQVQAWPAIQDRRHVLIAAPTGSGKTLAAFLAAIDTLVREGLAGGLSDAIQVVYVSPLKALSNDVAKNLQEPLNGIRDELFARGLPDVEIRTFVRTGDTPAAERDKMRRRPPHILVTTPESLYILLTSDSGRRALASTRTVIVDEIHALAGNKRGAHLSLSLERFAALTPRPFHRVGLSATQHPIESVANFLLGARPDDCLVLNSGHTRERDLELEMPDSLLEAVMSAEVWEEVYRRLVELVESHRTTLIFVNTRRYAERVAHRLAERLGETAVAAHHGSLSRISRLRAEQRLKAGELRVLVATASLELGIDIGEVDLVCQLGSPRTIGTFLQRVGRSGHALEALPKGRLFPLSRDDLVECAALLEAVANGELDYLNIPGGPLDVLAQQIVAEVACQEWGEEAFYEALRRAWPYRELQREQFSAVLHMLAHGYSTRRGRRSAYLHWDGVNARLRPRRGSKLTAVTNGGAIPDQFDYEVWLEPEGVLIGTLNEDFAFESLPGDIFQLGNTSYRILRVQQGTVRVEDAHGQPPNIPFWFGEAPGRSEELSAAVSRLRAGFQAELSTHGLAAAQQRIAAMPGISAATAAQLSEYLAAGYAALGALPTLETIVFERFFDQAGDMHLVIHSPFGSRINRAWGLALRKRFCRSFNFELQAAALEDSIVLSLSTTHSFGLDEVARYLNSRSVRPLLIQALLDAPMFTARWRWNASIALAIKRFRNGRKVAPQLQRMDAEDLIALVFPDQLACLENIRGDREIPDHPLVQQTIADCLHEAMDIDGMERLLQKLESGTIQVVVRDLNGPSPLAQEILAARPYAFLDDAPAEERRTQAVQARRFLEPQSATDLSRLDPEAIERVRQEAWPVVTTADELHEALVVLGFVTDQEGRYGSRIPSADVEGNPASGWQRHLLPLLEQRRAALLTVAPLQRLWIAAERLPEWLAVFPEASLQPPIAAPPAYASKPWTREEALREIIRSRLEGLGPTAVEALVDSLPVPKAWIEAALAELKGEGFALRGRYTESTKEIEWCERRLLARIHRYTVKRLRQEIEPVPAAVFMRFLLRWQGLLKEQQRQGPGGLAAVMEQLEGFQAAAGTWETDLLPARLARYEPAWLDQLCQSGRLSWIRLNPPRGEAEQRRTAPIRTTPITFMGRLHLRFWRSLVPFEHPPALSGTAERTLQAFTDLGALFFDELAMETQLSPQEIREALAELVAKGLVVSDSFAGLRMLLGASKLGLRPRSQAVRESALEDVGRWVRVRERRKETALEERSEYFAWVLLRRYGVVFRKLLERETGVLPPWRELLPVYRRLEARGELRGGRFVASFSGEQFALPEALGSLRDCRKDEPQGELVSVSAVDPVSLLGIVLPGARVPGVAANRILYQDGIPVACAFAGEVHFFQELAAAAKWRLRSALFREGERPGPATGTL